MSRLTIKQSPSLTSICDILGYGEDYVIREIIHKLGLLDSYILNDCNAGQNISDVMFESDLDVAKFLEFLPEPASPNFYHLEFWGEDYDCPFCGCKTEAWDYDKDENGENAIINKCTNCGKLKFIYENDL